MTKGCKLYVGESVPIAKDKRQPVDYGKPTVCDAGVGLSCGPQIERRARAAGYTETGSPQQPVVKACLVDKTMLRDSPPGRAIWTHLQDKPDVWHQTHQSRAGCRATRVRSRRWLHSPPLRDLQRYDHTKWHHGVRDHRNVRVGEV